MNPVTPWAHDRPVRNFNPGDLRPRSASPVWPGQDTIDHGVGGPFAIFVTVADGWAALGLWCLDARYLRGLKTAAAMIGVFAPPTENDTAAYTAGVTRRIGEGELDLQHTPTLEALCRAIAHWEDSRAVWSDVDIAAGMRLCTARWPAYRASRLQSQPQQPAAEVRTAEDLNQAELDKIHGGGNQPA